MDLRSLAKSISLFLAIGFCAASSAAAQQQDTAAQAPASTSTQQPAAPATKVTDVQSVTVTAEGEDRSVQSVDSTQLLEAAPGTSPIAVLARLPSVSVTASDPYGAYEWALRISVRGFNQNQLGFTLDDVPLGDMSYGNLNGLHISRAIIDEDMGHVAVSQGTGALDTASNSNLGGAVQFFSSDPLDKLKFIAAQSFGSFAGSRTFERFDSGLLPTHTRFYFAGVYQRSDKWRGAGQINQRYFQFNTKIQQYVGSKGMLTFYADYSDRREVDYQDDNKIWVQKLGYNWDNYGDWGKSIQAASACNGIGTYPGPVNTLAANEDPCDAGYYGGSGLRKDFLSYLNYKTAITSHLTSKSTVYGHYNAGRGLWFTPYTPTYQAGFVAVSPISLRTSEYGISRAGFLTSLSYETSRNTLEGGVWFEKESFDLARRFYATSLDSPMHSLYSFPTNPFYTQWAYNFPSTVYQIHIQDRYNVTNDLSVSAGFKVVETNMTGNLTAFDTGVIKEGTAVSTYAQGSLESGKPFLPQIGANYKLGKKNEFFADVAENVRAYQAGGNGFGNSPWGTTQAGFNVLTNTLKPESAWSEEAGLRHTDRIIQAQANYFHVNYANRLLAITQGAGIAGNASILSNVGGVTTNGVDGAISIVLPRSWTLYNAITFSKSTYDSNFTSGGVNYDTAGKVGVDSPEVLYKNELSYSGLKGFDIHIDSDYMGKRYFTYSNDGSVDGRFLANFGTSYHTEQVGPFSELKLQFNIYNLTSEKYWSTIGTNGFVYSDPQSVADNTLQVGAPRAITGSFSAKF
jgi:iron complex outermembrane receptor protein